MGRSFIFVVALAGLIASALPALAGDGLPSSQGAWLGNWLAGPLPGQDYTSAPQVAAVALSQPRSIVQKPVQTVSSGGRVNYKALNAWMSAPRPGQPAPQLATAVQPHPLAPAPAALPKPPVVVVPSPVKKEKWLDDWLAGAPPGENFKPVAAQAVPSTPIFEQPLQMQPVLAPVPPSTPIFEQQPSQQFPRFQPTPLPLNEAPVVDDIDFNDPLEPMNRMFFGFNEGLQDYFLHPLATAYKMLPEFVRGAFSSFLLNLRSPVVFANDLLQFEPMRAFQTGSRMVINSTAGIGGLVDVAGMLGIDAHNEDFGQTLAVWGVGEGFYLVLPVIGPTNPRDVIGKFGVDPFMDPFSYYLNGTDNSEWIVARTVAEGFDAYVGLIDEIDQINKTSMDYYASIRSMYRQKRQVEILNGTDVPLVDIPEIQE